MASAKKNGTYLNVYIETPIYEKFCENARQIKTTSVEQALHEYLDNYNKKQQLLEELKNNG